MIRSLRRQRRHTVIAAATILALFTAPVAADSVRRVAVDGDATAAGITLAPAPRPDSEIATGDHGGDGDLDALPYRPGRLVVKLDDHAGDLAAGRARAADARFGVGQLDALNRRYGASKLERPYAGRDARLARGRGASFVAGTAAPSFEHVYVVELSRYLDMEQVAREYQSASGVVFAEPDREVETTLATNDPYLSSSGTWGQAYGDLWGLAKIDAEGAWDVSVGAGTVVAVIDTGVDFGHPELAARAWANVGEIAGNSLDDDDNGYVDDAVGWDFFSGDNDPFDDFGHGTHVAGTVAAEGNNALGIVGVAWQAEIMAVRGLSGGGGYETDLAEAILYAVDNGADVINASWGGLGHSQLISDAVAVAHAAGVVFVTSAGNSARDAQEFFPAGDEKAITVSAFDSTDTIAFFSNFGSAIDVAAPGGGDVEPKGKYAPYRSVLSLLSSGAASGMTDGGKLIVDDDYVRQAGTSMASPHVAGAAALVIAARPQFSVEQVRQVLRASADDVDLPGVDTNSGYGRLNAGRALLIDSTLDVTIDAPAYDEVVSSNGIEIVGTVDGVDFQSYSISYGTGAFPTTWLPIVPAALSPVVSGSLGVWDLSDVVDGTYTIRVQGMTTFGYTFEDRVTVALDRIIVSDPPSYSIHRAGEPITIHGTAYAPGFSSYALDYRVISPDLVEGPWQTTGIALAGGGTSPVFDGTLATFDTGSFSVGSELDLRLTVTSTSGAPSEIFFHVVIDPDFRSGWPVQIPGLPNSTIRMQGHVNLADLDGDGTKEILAAYGDLVFVLSHDGSDLPGWPQSVADDDPDYTIRTDTAPAAADLDNDGDLELVAGNGKSIFVWHHDGTPFAGWPKVFGFGEEPYVWGTPRGDFVLADLDGDGLRDILLTSGPTVAAIRSDGSYLPGWPVTIFSIYLSPPPFEPIPAVGDVTGDGRPEVVVVEAQGTHRPMMLHVYDATGNQLPGFPARLTKKYRNDHNSPVLADLDGNGVLDIAANTDKVKKLAAFDGTGRKVRLRTKIPNFRAKVFGAGRFDSEQELLTAGDIDGDGQAELVVSTSLQQFRLRCSRHTCRWTFLIGRLNGTNYLQVVEPRERKVEGWPVAHDFVNGDHAHGLGSAAIGDVDGDGGQDLVTGSGMCWAANGYAYHRCFSIDAVRGNGSRLPGFPKPVPWPGPNKLMMPAIGDLDGDGLKEIVFIDFAGNVLVWTVPGTPGPENFEWPMFRRNPARTGALD